jgi:hypothetical protein
VGRVSASGRIAFRMPHVAAGRYQLFARMPAGPPTRFFRVSGTFRVVR